MSEEEFFNRMINQISKVFDGRIATKMKNIYLRKEKQLNKQKKVLDKIKEYCNHKLEMLELQKRNIMQILTPENGYLKTDIEIEMQKYKDILELLEEIE